MEGSGKKRLTSQVRWLAPQGKKMACATKEKEKKMARAILKHLFNVARHLLHKIAVLEY